MFRRKIKKYCRRLQLIEVKNWGDEEGSLFIINVELEGVELGVLDEADEIGPARVLEQVAWHHDGLVGDERDGELVILDDGGKVLERVCLLVHGQDLDVPISDWHGVVDWDERQLVEIEVPGWVQVGQAVADELLAWCFAAERDVLLHLRA